MQQAQFTPPPPKVPAITAITEEQRELAMAMSVIIPPAEQRFSPPLRLPPNIVAKDYAWAVHKYPSGQFVKWCDGDSYITNSGLIYLRGVPMTNYLKGLAPL